MAEEPLLRLISSAYRAAVEPDEWTSFLRQFAQTVGGKAGALHWMDKARMEHVHAWQSGLCEDDLADYADHYWANDPRVNWAFMHPQGTVFVDYDFTTESQMDRSAYYAHFLERQDLRYCIGIIALDDSCQTCGIAVHRSPRQGHFDAPEVRLARQLTPHLRRALQVQHRLSVVEAREHFLTTALDHLATGTIFVDSRARPLLMNQAAERILRQGDGLCATPSGLAAAKAEDTACLRRAVFEAAATGAGRGHSAGGAMRLSRPSAKRPLEVLVSPLPRHHHTLGAVDPAAIVFVSDPERQLCERRELLIDLHGLTPAEAELAEALLAGQSLSQFAERTGRGAQTVRKFLKHIFSKTGTSRQAELVRLLLDGPAGLEVPPSDSDRSRRL
jgi:DNA-binding CsgD family transcriptional regulator/PAS domain-containing protein